MTFSSDLLHDALEGHAPAGPAYSELAGLVRVARQARPLHVVGPTSDAAMRMRAEFARLIDEPRRPRLFVWLLAWTPLSPRPRPLVARLAAGVVLVAGAATSATTVGGDGPVDAVAGIAHFAANAVANLLPRADTSIGPLVPPTPTLTLRPASDQQAGGARPEPTETPPPPTASPTPGPSRSAAGSPGLSDPTSTPATAPGIAPDIPRSATSVPLPTTTPKPSPTAAPSLTPTEVPFGGTPLPPTPTPPATPTASPTPSPSPSPSATSTPHDDNEEDEAKQPDPTQTPQGDRR